MVKGVRSRGKDEMPQLRYRNDGGLQLDRTPRTGRTDDRTSWSAAIL